MIKYLTVLFVLCCFTLSAAELKKVKTESLKGVYQLDKDLFVGPAPVGNQFKELQKLGIKSLISVDGAKPQITLAGSASLAYAHIPVPYKGINEKQKQAILAAHLQLPKPIYLHCHHGVHRAPTAAMLILLNSKNTDKQDAVSTMKKIGTGDNYKGLYKTVQDYQLISESTIKGHPRVPAVSQLQDQARQMAEIDRIFDRLKLHRSKNWHSTAKHDALLLREAFTEVIRFNKDKDLNDKLNVTKADSEALEKLLIEKAFVKASLKLDKIKRDCKACHETFRD